MPSKRKLPGQGGVHFIAAYEESMRAYPFEDKGITRRGFTFLVALYSLELQTNLPTTATLAGEAFGLAQQTAQEHVARLSSKGFLNTMLHNKVRRFVTVSQKGVRLIRSIEKDILKDAEKRLSAHWVLPQERYNTRPGTPQRRRDRLKRLGIE